MEYRKEKTIGEETAYETYEGTPSEIIELMRGMKKEGNVTIVDTNNDNEVVAVLMKGEAIIEKGYEVFKDVGIED